MVDYLSGDSYTSERTSNASGSAPMAVPTRPKTTIPTAPPTPPPPSSSPPSDDFINPTASMFADEPAPAPAQAQAPGYLPPPPSKHSQRVHFFEQSTSDSPSGSRSYDSLVGKTQNLSINSSTPTKKEKTEDALFKDLVDFAKAKSSPSASSNPNKSFWVKLLLVWIGNGWYSLSFLNKLLDFMILETFGFLSNHWLDVIFICFVGYMSLWMYIVFLIFGLSIDCISSFHLLPPFSSKWWRYIVLNIWVKVLLSFLLCSLQFASFSTFGVCFSELAHEFCAK